MRDVSALELEQVSGGFLQAIGALVAILVLPKIIHDHTQEYNEWGRNLGEYVYEYNHPYDPNK